MNVYQCDRCGKIVDSLAEVNQGRYIICLNPKTKYLSSMNKPAADTIQLCNDCSDFLDYWVDESTDDFKKRIEENYIPPIAPYKPIETWGDLKNVICRLIPGIEAKLTSPEE